ncbi:MAG: hypothetical protein ACFB5Z_08240 [Elainellaceae cyanobacterium]
MSDFTQPSLNGNQTELEFLQQVLADASERYCWEFIEREADADPGPTEPESADLRPERLDETPFFDSLELAWNQADAALALETQIHRSLGDRLPQPLLQALLTNAQQAIHRGQSLGEQLVQCVQGLTPQLDEDDLQVMVRPYTLAMRNQKTAFSLETLRASVRAAQWTDLSPIERARLSIGISHYLLAHLPHHTPRP